MLNKIKISWLMILLFLFFQISNCFGTIIIYLNAEYQANNEGSSNPLSHYLKGVTLPPGYDPKNLKEDVYLIFGNYQPEIIINATPEQIAIATARDIETDANKTVKYFLASEEGSVGDDVFLGLDNTHAPASGALAPTTNITNPIGQHGKTAEKYTNASQEFGVSGGLLNFFLDEQVLSQGYVTQNRWPPPIEDLGGRPEDYLYGVPVGAPEAALPTATVKIRVGEKRTAPADDTQGSGEAEPFAKKPSHEQVMHERQVETYMVFAGLLTRNPDVATTAFSYPMWRLNQSLPEGKKTRIKVVLYNGYKDGFTRVHSIEEMIAESWTMPEIETYVRENNILCIQIYDPTEITWKRNLIETPETFLQGNQKSTSTEAEGQLGRLHSSTFDITKTPANALPRVTLGANVQQLHQEGSGEPEPPAKRARTDDQEPEWLCFLA